MRIESAFNRFKDFQTHHIPLRQPGAKLLGRCLPDRSAGMVDLMGLETAATTVMSYILMQEFYFP
jgi:hypothetical protein